MNVIKVWVPPREYLSVQALYDAANALYWKISERQNSTHLAFLKHQNTKTSLCELSKNHWVIAPFYISGPIKRKLQSTVSLDHPVAPRILKDVSMILSTQEATETTEAPLYTSGSLPRPRFKSLWTSWFQKVDCERQVCDAWPARGGQEQHCQQSSWLRQPCQPGQEEEQEEGGFCKQIQMINWDTKNKGKYE